MASLRVQIFVAAIGASACGFPRPAELQLDAAMADGGDDAAVNGIAPSCATAPATCGAGMNVSCCDTVVIPGGMYWRSYDVAGDQVSGPKDAPASLTAFRLDRYEVTVGRFRAFVHAGAGTQLAPPVNGAGAHAKLANSGWDAHWNFRLASSTSELTSKLKCDVEGDPSLQTWTDSVSLNENRPINCVSWYEAMAFCAWDGGYLPTEAEWNFAAAGGAEQRAYPWSNPPGSLEVDATRASYNCLGDGDARCSVTDMVAVGTKPAGDSRWGAADLAGNANEWVLDAFADYQMPCDDCANLVVGDPVVRMNRGGGNNSGVVQGLRTNVRRNSLADLHATYLGFRCARPAR